MKNMTIKNYELKLFLTLINKFGYPNSNLGMISNSFSYNLLGFMIDYFNEFGQKKTDEFVEKAFTKLFGKDLTHRFDLDDGDFFTMKITEYQYSHKEGAVQISFKIINSRFMNDDGEYKSLEWFENEYDPWDMEDFYNFILEEIYQYIFENLGIVVIYFQ